jgi:hypothetical protein
MLTKFYFSLSAFLGVLLWGFTQQEFLAWVATISAGISAVVLALLPLYKRMRDTIRESNDADRKAKRKDCLEALKKEKAKNVELAERNNHLADRNKTLERTADEWERLYKAGSKDHEQMG